MIYTNNAIDAKCIAYLYQQLPSILAGGLAAAFLLAYSLTSLSDVPRAWYWWGAVLTVTVVRILSILDYRRNFVLGENTFSWQVRFTVGAFASGVAWASAFFLFPAEFSLPLSYTVLVVAGVMALSSNFYGASIGAFLAFNVPIAMIVFLRLVGGNETRLVALASLIYLVVIALSAMRGKKQLQETFRLELANSSLARDLDAQKVQTKRFNQRLELQVKARTANLSDLNDQLRDEVAAKEHTHEILAESEARFRTLYHQQPSILLTLDNRGAIIDVNQYGADYLEYTHATLARMNFAELASSSKDVSDMLRQCLQEKSDDEHRHRVQLIKSTGEVITTQATARKIHKPGENPRILLACEDVTEIDELQQQLSYFASRDTLTSLYNRREFEQRLNQLFEITKRHGGEQVLCCIDLDQFKNINDTSGHIAGDEILKTISETMRNTMRQSDVLARVGGDEFGILMEKTALTEAEAIVERLRKEIEKIEFIWEGRRHTVSASFGLTEINSESRSVKAILRDADTACYMAKRSGRNCIRHVLGGEECDKNREQQINWSGRLENAIRENNLILALQEIFEPSSGEVRHWEALLRIQERDGTVSSPAKFMAAAERFGLMPELDRWVIKNATSLLMKDRRFKSNALISVNLSGASLLNMDFRGFLDRHIKEHRTFAHQFCFELNESFAFSSLEPVIKFIKELKPYGCRFAIDDFGSGIGSFTTLRKIGVDYIKIDEAIIRDVCRDRLALELVSSMVKLAQLVDVETIAEAVSSAEIANEVTRVGVHGLQGYAIGKPEIVFSQDIAAVTALA